MFFDPFTPPSDYVTPPPTPPHGHSCNCCPTEGCGECRRLCDCNNGDMRCSDSSSEEEYSSDEEMEEDDEEGEGEGEEWVEEYSSEEE
jgi:hypothetical protein